MKKFFQAIAGFFAMIFGNAKKFEQFLIDHADDAIEIVGKIKLAVNNPVIMSLMMFLPERYRTAASEGMAKVEAVLDKVLQELVISNVCLQKATLGERLKCFVDQIKTLPPAMQDAAYHKFASLYAKHSSGKDLPTSYFDTAVQDRFFQKRQNITL